MVAAVEDMIRRHQRQQCVDSMWMGNRRQVEIERFERRHHFVRHEGRRCLAEAHDIAANAMREERQRAAAMRYDDAHVRATAERPRCNQVHDHPRSIEREFHDRRGKAQLLDVKSRRRDRMHEHDRLAPVEFIENRIEPFVAEIDAVDVRKQDDAVELEHRQAGLALQLWREARQQVVQRHEKRRLDLDILNPTNQHLHC